MSDLLKAVDREDPDEIRRLLGAGANVNAMWGITPLGAAVARGAPDDLLSLLLAHGADIERGTRTGETPLILAARQGYAGVVRFLLAHGADVDARDKSDGTALSNAVMNDDPYCFAELVAAGADLKYRNRIGLTLLDFAYNGRRPLASILLIDAGVRIEQASFAQGRKAAEATAWILHVGPALHAAEVGDADLLERHLRAGASPDARLGDDTRRPLLITAADRGREPVVRLLLDHGADVNIHARKGGHSALTAAAMRGYRAVVSLLLERGANVAYAVDAGDDALAYAAASGYVDLVFDLVRFTESRDVRLNVEHAAARAEMRGHVDIARSLRVA